MSGPEARAALISGLRRLAAPPGLRPGGPGAAGATTLSLERCDFCRTRLGAEHRHLLDVQERRILCVCETCVIRRSEDPRYRPPGRRRLRLPGFRLSDEVWSRFHIPVGLAFFLFSGPAQRVIALYPSPLGATESELDLAAWEDLVRENLMLASLEADTEALLVRRQAGMNLVPEHYVVPTDDCYRLVGLLKSAWKGITGGAAAERAIEGFFGETPGYSEGSMNAPLSHSPLPRPSFEVLGAEAVPFTACPTLAFTLRVQDHAALPVYTIALTCQVNLEPAQRGYDEATRDRLLELFGTPERWTKTARSLLWVKRDVLVPSFQGETSFELQVACGNDLQLAAERYFTSLSDGDVPLTFLFNGTIFYEEEQGRMQLVQVPWECQASYRLPVATWRDLIASHYQDSSWVRLRTATVEHLGRYKAHRGLLSFDHCVEELLAEVETGAPN